MTLQITIDAAEPSALARFWAEALPSYEVRTYDHVEIARLAAKGLTRETDMSVALDGAGLTLWFQRPDDMRPEARPNHKRNRIHIDLAYARREPGRRRRDYLHRAQRSHRDARSRAK